QEGGLLRRYTKEEGMPAVAVRGLLMLDGRLYVGSERGLYSGLEGRFRREGSNPVLDQALVTALTLVGANKLLVGTFDDGLFLLDVTGVTPIGLAEGLPWPQVANLQVDQTHVWSSGPRGVYRFGLDELDALLRQGTPLAPEPILNEARDARGGQRLRCCNGGATSRGLILNSRLWFPSLNGLVRIDPASIRPERKPPKTVIEAVESDDGRRWLAQESLRLPEGLRDLTVRFTALSFRDPEGLRFRYRLHGFEQDWHSPGAHRMARYTNLAPGRYRFEVDVLSGGSEQPRSTAEMVLVIPPYLTETVWFRSLVLLGILGLAAMLAAWMRRRSQQRERHLQELVERRTEELRRVNDRLRSANQALAAESLTDGLTGLKNRRFLARHLGGWRREHLLGEQPSDERLWLFLIDLDHFKAINDRHGHLAGDEMLCQFAQLLLRIAGGTGEALRWGGEEFLILMPEHALRSPEDFAERIVRAVRRADFRANEHTSVPLTASVGVASFPALADRSDLVDWALAMELADAGLYHSKLNGRDGWSRLHPAAEARYRDFGSGAGAQIEAVLEAGLARWEQSGQDRASTDG
ncbi:MAG: diguanylate cyclase, partial [Xanthomonadales bacterium]|nr:diguanylate cyclase [Xanthomonadales bacterium]